MTSWRIRAQQRTGWPWHIYSTIGTVVFLVTLLWLGLPHIVSALERTSL